MCGSVIFGSGDLQSVIGDLDGDRAMSVLPRVDQWRGASPSASPSSFEMG